MDNRSAETCTPSVGVSKVIYVRLPCWFAVARIRVCPASLSSFSVRELSAGRGPSPGKVLSCGMPAIISGRGNSYPTRSSAFLKAGICCATEFAIQVHVEPTMPGILVRFAISRARSSDRRMNHCTM